MIVNLSSENVADDVGGVCANVRSVITNRCKANRWQSRGGCAVLACADK
jgi:hypothetical protein